MKNSKKILILGNQGYVGSGLFKYLSMNHEVMGWSRKDNILNITNHRPWEIPRGSWKFYQEWNNAVFLHWQVELAELKKFVPRELEIDLFEGKPWISLVAFTMEKIRLKNFFLPKLCLKSFRCNFIKHCELT